MARPPLAPVGPLLRRAGWDIIVVGDSGSMIAGAFGPVPGDFAPLHLAEDGEDFAFFMLSELALDIESAWADCAAAVAAARSRVRSTSAKRAQVHMWA